MQNVKLENFQKKKNRRKVSRPRDRHRCLRLDTKTLPLKEKLIDICTMKERDLLRG
jgi:urease accessory protein UreE